jgi:1,4-dihydroxy-2-naphthoyl-CoA hydrolase
VLGAMGTVVNLPPGHRTTTIESKTNFFAAGEGPALRAVCVPLHIGRTTMVWQTTITNPDGRKVAIVTQTQIVIQAKTGAASADKSAKRRMK